ncbi:MAG: YitT family protein [Bacteroidales bacterium]|nr:YitT family protein [Bacteroidales bacterium]
MEKKKRTPYIVFKEYLIISIGLLLYALGWSTFLIPNNLVGGGVTGISAIILYATGFPISYSYIIINGLLVAIALKVLGKQFGVKTVYAILIVSIFFKVIPGLIPTELIQDIAIGNGKLLSAIMGGVCSGVGIAITFTQGGSSGGTDIIALMISKFRNISPGKLILYCDIIIIASSMLIPDNSSLGEKLAVVIYGYILITVSSYTIDLVLSGARQSIQIFIFSKQYEEIAERITSLGRGVTVIDAMGWFTKEKGKVLMVIVRRTESNYVFRIIREIDKGAFISVGNVMGVYGQGFDQIKK